MEEYVAAVSRAPLHRVERSPSRRAVLPNRRLDPPIAAIETWIGHFTAWRKEFCEAMDTLPARAADRTREQEQQVLGFTSAVKNIDFGCTYMNGFAMVATVLREKIMANYQPTWGGSLDPWSVGYGCLPAAEERLVDLRQRRDALQTKIDAVMRASETVSV
jgi:hypothetical protein